MFPYIWRTLYLSICLANSLAVDLSTCLALQARWVRGALVFTLVCTGCLGFVIFATGKAEPLEPLRTYLPPTSDPTPTPTPTRQAEPLWPSPRRAWRRAARRASGAPRPARTLPQALPQALPQPQPPSPVATPNPNQARLDLLLGKLALFLIFNGVSLAIILFFTFTPIYNAGEARNRTAWGDACDANDELALAALGLS